MNINRWPLVYLFFIVLFIFACRSDKLPEPTPSDCPTIPTYNDQVKEIVDASCAIQFCHDNSGSAPGNFLTYVGMQSRLENGVVEDRVFITADMPFAPGELSAEDKAVLRCWLDNGAPE